MLILVSVLAGAIGMLVTYATMTLGAAAHAGRDPHWYWVLGLVGLMPAWLIAFVSLLPTTTDGRVPLLSAAAWILSPAAGLIGVIATETVIREPARVTHDGSARRCWVLGAVAVGPAWVIAILGHVVG